MAESRKDYEPLPGPVKCLGLECDRVFNSVDRRTNRFCPACARKLARAAETGQAVRVYHVMGGRQSSTPDD